MMAYLVKSFLYLLYHPFAWLYDWVSMFVSVDMWQEWVTTAVRYVEGSPVLELGHGPGHLQNNLAELNHAPFGLDESRQMGQLARRNIANNKNSDAKPPRLIRAKAQAIPFPSNSFSTIISTFPTKYIFDPQSLAEIYRTLSPGSRLVIVMSGWITGTSLRYRLASFLFQITGESEGWDASWAIPLRRAGFSVDVQQVILTNSYVWVLLATKPANGDGEG